MGPLIGRGQVHVRKTVLGGRLFAPPNMEKTALIGFKMPLTIIEHSLLVFYNSLHHIPMFIFKLNQIYPIAAC